MMGNMSRFHIRLARPDEAGLFYTPHPEEDKRLGTIGHVRMDFGRSGNEFWHTWWPRDFVLTGGEIPAMALADCLCRMVPGVLPEESCYTDESHWDGLLEYPQYSRPEEWHGRKVPEVLLSGHHGKVDDWRKKESYKRTMTRRPDLFSRFDETSLTTKHDRKVLAEAKAEWAAEQESPAAE